MSQLRTSIVGLLLSGAVLSAQVTFSEYAIPSPPSGTSLARITAGPDGNLWFTQYDPNYGVDSVGRITTAGVITHFAARQGGGITAGRDGALWFTEAAFTKIGRITTAGAFTEYATNAIAGDITSGPDGNLWFYDGFLGYGNFNRMNVNGVITGSFPWNAPSSNSSLTSITAGPDGNLWATEGTFGGILKITTAGAMTKYLIPTGIPTPKTITAGSDGNLWFAQNDAAVWRITTAGFMTSFALPPNTSAGAVMTLGPDGNVWFTAQNFTNDGIGRITPAGVFTFFPESHAAGSSFGYGAGIAAGPDGNLWFPEPSLLKIAKAGLPGARVTNIFSTNPNGTYGPGSVITIEIAFNDVVSVTGTPQLPLNSGGVASYTSGSGTNTLTFTYNVGTGQNALRLDATAFMALAMNLHRATILDSSGNFAILTLPLAPAVGSLGVNNSITIAPTIPVTIDSTQSALTFTATGTGCQLGSYSTPTTLNWAISASCTVAFSTPQSAGLDTQYVFTGWADGGVTDNPRTIATPASPTTYTASFKTQYQLATGVSPAGTGTISGAGYYDAGSAAPITATPSTNYQFFNWTGLVTSPNNSSTTVAMTAPASVTANFQLISTTTVGAVSGKYGDTVTLSAMIGPPGAVFTGTLQFQVAGVNVGSAIPVTGAGAFTTSYTISQGAGNYIIAAALTSTTQTVANSSGPATLSVSPAPTTITWPAPAATTYGAVLSSTQLNATAIAANTNPAGTLVYLPAAGTLLPAGANQTLSVAFTPADTTRYTAASATTTINVSKAFASATAAAAGKIYGQSDPNPLTTGVLTGFLPSDNVTATYSRIGGETVGTYPISTSLAPMAALANYSIVYNPAIFIIQPATPVLPPPQTGATTYGVTTTLNVTISPVNGGTIPTGALTFQFIDNNTVTWYICSGGAVQTQTCSVPLDNTGKANVITMSLPAGTDNVIAIYSGDSNYAGGGQTALNFSVMQANTQTTLTITPNNPAPTYGTPVALSSQIADASLNSSGIPTGKVQFAYSLDIGATWTNLGDAVTLDATGKAQIETTSLPAPAPIVRAVYSGDPNFVASSVSVAQTVSPKALIVTGITAQDKTYDGTMTAIVSTANAALAGIVTSDNVTLSGTATGVFADANAGANKLVTITGLTLAGASAFNYILTAPTPTASINRAPLTIAADNEGTIYGESLPALSFTPMGFVNGESSAVLSGSPSLSTAATPSSPVGVYQIASSQGTLSSTNYAFGFLNGTLTVNKAAASVSLGSLAATYDGTPKSATAITAPTGVAVTYTYNGSSAAPTVVGSYTVVGTVNDNNYAGSATGTLVISKGTASVTLGNLTATYDGTPKSAIVTTIPSSLTVTFTYNGSGTPPISAGSYTAVGTINDANYAGSATGTLIISKATATVTLGSLTATFDGTPKSATATTNPPGLTVTFTYNGSPTAPTSAGSYTVVGTINDADHAGSGTGTLIISKVTATVTLGSLTATYDGTPKPATATTNPAGLVVTIMYNGSLAAPTAAGSYTVVGTITDPNYMGSATGTLVISSTAKVPPSGNACNGSYSGTFTGNLTVSAGQNCIFIGGGVTGNITQTGGNLTLVGSTVGNNVQIEGGGTFSITGSTNIKGNLQIQNLPPSSAQNQICGSNIKGNLQYQNSGAPVEIGDTSSCPGNTVGGNLQVENNPAVAVIYGNTVTGNLEVQDNSAPVIVSSDTVGSSMIVQNNTVSSQVFENKVTSNLQCNGDSSITGGGNTAKQKLGQCAAF